MPAIFDTLPGLVVPVGEITSELAALWTDTAARGRPAPAAEDARATQVNLVLHFGMKTTPADAREQFDVLLRFSQRYPSRVVVLCPLHADVPAPEMRAKIFGECFLGRSKSDKRCVEFVMLSYSRSARPFLENQVSICLSTDLPLYYWPHRFSDTARLADYQRLLSRAKRVLLDSATAPANALAYPWPNPSGIRDLVYCRLLPVRQSLGQFLAAYPPARLVDGLQGVRVMHEAALAAEGQVMLDWFRQRLADCGANMDSIQFAGRAAESDGNDSLAVQFDYGNRDRFFRWKGDLRSGHAEFEANFGTGITRLPAGISLMAPENALSEAMFF